MYSHKSLSTVEMPCNASTTIGVKLVLAVEVHSIVALRPGQISLVNKVEEESLNIEIIDIEINIKLIAILPSVEV